MHVVQWGYISRSRSFSKHFTTHLLRYNCVRLGWASRRGQHGRCCEYRTAARHRVAISFDLSDSQCISSFTVIKRDQETTGWACPSMKPTTKWIWMPRTTLARAVAKPYRDPSRKPFDAISRSLSCSNSPTRMLIVSPSRTPSTSTTRAHRPRKRRPDVRLRAVQIIIIESGAHARSRRRCCGKP